MAVIGLRYPIWSPRTSGGAGTPIVYGTPVTGDHAISAVLSWNRNNTPLYGDDVAVEIDNSATGGTITMGVDHLSDALRASMLGEVETTPGSGIYEVTDSAAPYGGFGYVRVLRNNGVTTYEANWLHQVQFVENEENANTRAESIEWQTPTLTGAIFAVDLDGSGTLKLRKRQIFSTLTAAKAYLDGLA